MKKYFLLLCLSTGIIHATPSNKTLERSAQIAKAEALLEEFCICLPKATSTTIETVHVEPVTLTSQPASTKKANVPDKKKITPTKEAPNEPDFSAEFDDMSEEDFENVLASLQEVFESQGAFEKFDKDAEFSFPPCPDHEAF